MRISTKAEQPGPAYRVYLDGRPSPLFVAYDKTMKEWDLCTEQEHILSASARGTIMRRLELLAGILVGAAG